MATGENKDVVILGAGIAGISAAYHAKKIGMRVSLYEARGRPGGLLDNFTIDGFRFDNAIHLSFTKDDYVRTLFDQIPYYTHMPESYCKDGAFWLKHPVQNNLFPLPVDEKISLIESFVERPMTTPQNYKEWLNCQYGLKFSAKYPEQYTLKYWGLEPEKLSLNWIGNRVRKADSKEILMGAFEPRDDNHYYAAEMRYPKHGGYYSFIRNMANEVNVECDKEALSISLSNRTVTFKNGTRIQYNNLISSLPLPIICNIIEECPPSVLEASNSLLWTTVDLISIGFNIPDIPPYLWFYIYDDDCIAARAYSPSLKSPDNAPQDKSSLQFEIYNLSTKKRLDKNTLISNIKEKLLEMKICKEDGIEFIHHKHLPFGNVVFDIGMEERRQVVLDFLKINKIYTCGRFGEWDYLWSDQSLLSGKKLAERIFAKNK